METDKTEQAVEHIENLFTIAEVEIPWLSRGIHYVIRCARSATGHYTISCACGHVEHTGRTASAAHGLMRAHVAGHAFGDTIDDV